jgi:haloacetate dehalogenase
MGEPHESSQALFPAAFSCERRAVNGVTLNLRHNVAGDRPALLLLHGFPQSHAIWHRIAPELAGQFALVMPDLRGYGDSDKPSSDAEHATYSKRTMAKDCVELMRSFGFETFFVCGHDRGARVAHRLALDHPGAVRKLTLLDIAPTLTMYEQTNQLFAQLYYHWFFLIQPAPLPETLIGSDPRFYVRAKLGGAQQRGLGLFDPRALAEYERCVETPGAVHAMCEDYRASASIDLAHDRADAEQRIACPVHVLWGERGVIHRLWKPIAEWQRKARGPVTGHALPSGHYIPEEVPAALLAELRAFFAPNENAPESPA